MVKIIKGIVHRIGRAYIKRVLLSEFSDQSFSHHNERSIEYRFALEHLALNRPRTVLDVGTGTTSWPRLLRDCGFMVTAVDNISDYWPEGMMNSHWHVVNEDIVKPRRVLDSPFDAITCISVLEHIDEHLEAVLQMYQLLREGGLLILTCPFNSKEYCENVYTRDDALYGQDAVYKCSAYSAIQLAEWEKLGTLIAAEFWSLFSGPFWACGKRTDWRRSSQSEPHQLGCFAFQKRSSLATQVDNSRLL